MSEKEFNEQTQPITPRWAGWKGASIYSGFSVGTLKNHAAAGHIRTANVVADGNLRGRRLVDLRSLDQFIEEGVSRPPSKIATPTDRKANLAEVVA